MNVDEARSLTARLTACAVQHTDIIIALTRPDHSHSQCRGVGSTVHLSYRSRQVSITCSHVAKEDCLYFTNPKQLPKPIIPEGDRGVVQNVELLGRSEKYDIAILESSCLPMTSHSKSRYPLERSRIVTKDLLLKHGGLASLVYGVWGEMTAGFNYPDGRSYAEVVTYSALGPIVSVTDDEIICDITEKDDLRQGTPTLDRIKHVTPTGGSRDISGCSGCGVWIMGDEPVFAATLLGPREATRAKHLVRCTPVWHTIRIVDDLLAHNGVEPIR